MTDILDLEGWKPVSKHIDGGEMVIEAEYAVQPTACLKCGVIGNLYKHGPKPIYIRDAPVRGKTVQILAKAQRYKCRSCNGTFIQPLGGLYGDMRMTARCVEYIEDQCLLDTFKRVSEHVGCDDKTVRTVADGLITRLNAEYNPWLPEWLGIDETKIDGEQRCVITDVVNRIPIDMLPDRELPTVTQWLYQFRDRRAVKGLAIDMYRGYKGAFHAIFPGVPVVIDKFHLVRMADFALGNIRVALAKSKAKEVGRDWMRRKALLRMRYKNLNEKGRFNLQMWLDNEPDIAIAYRLKEAFYDIYDAPSKEEAAQLLDEWRAAVPPGMRKSDKDFKPLLTSTRNWRDEMLAFFDHPITNGYTEALNGVAKVINRAGRGYSFEVLRARLLFRKRRQPPAPPAVGAATVRAMYPANQVQVELLSKRQDGRCWSCKGVFADDDLADGTLHAFACKEAGDRPVLICPRCAQRFHTELAMHRASPSTP